MKNTFYVFMALVLMTTLVGCKSKEEKQVDAAVEASQEMMKNMDPEAMKAAMDNAKVAN